MGPFQDCSVVCSLFDRVSDGVFGLDCVGNIIFCNGVALGLLGLSGEYDLYGRHITQIFPKEAGLYFQRQLSQSLESQTTLQFDLALNDQRHWMEVNLYPSEDGVTVLFRDVTSKKLVENALKEQQVKLELLNETTKHIVFKTNPKELLDSLFQEITKHLDLDVYFHYLFDESKNLIRLTNFTGIPDTVAKDIEWIDFGEAVSGSSALQRKIIVEENIDQSAHPRVQIVKGLGIKAYACYPLISYGKLIGTLSFGSSTRSKFTQEELDLIFKICHQVAATLDQLLLITKLEKKMEEVEKANRIKSDFLSMMSHELRTPLNSIIGFAQILGDDKKEELTAKQQDRVHKILKSGRHLLSVINDILEVAKLGRETLRLKLEPLQIETVLQDCLQMLKPQMDEKKICIQNKIESFPKHVIADQTRLTQVLLNLLSNAIHFSYPHGMISITYERQNDHLKVTVSDNGIGISPEEHEQIFKPFYRIFNRVLHVEGTGIGLTLVKHYVEEMNGSVGVTSHLGEGSSFWITLPILQ
jgi:signal transduction histidine kinase